jgi:hypothetical protein
MKIKVQRRFKGQDYTIGSMFINHTYFCDTLEDRVRDIERDGKVYGWTAIPEGVYKVILNISPKFKRKLPRLLNVPYFEGILIHRGNTAADTYGCILIGENKVKGKVINSTQYEIKLVQLIEDAIARGEVIEIEIG